MGGDEAPPPLSVTGQPLVGAPAVVNGLHFRFRRIIVETLVS